MVDFIRKYWLTIVSAFAGTVVVTGTAHFGMETVDAYHTVTSCVETVGDYVGYLHDDPGNQFSNAPLYLMEGVAAGSAKAMENLKDKIEELGSNVKHILEKEEDIKDAKDAAHNAKNKVQKLSNKNAELVDQIKELQDDQSEIKDMVDELDIKFQDAGERGPKNVGKEFVSQVQDKLEQKGYTKGQSPVAGDTFKATLDGHGMKDITNAGASAGDVVFPDERDEIISSPVLRTPSILDLVTILETDSDAVEWVLQTSETDNAGPQSGQGSALSQSDFSYALQTQPVETIGHIAKSSVQILNDAPRLRSWINTRMRQLLELEAEDQVLTGDGTGNNLNGLVPNASNYNTSLEGEVVDGTVTDLDRIGVSLLQLQRNNFPPTGIVLSPINWWGITLQKDGNDNYQFANAQSMTSPRLWGFPVVSSNAMPPGEALVGNFELASTFFDRRQTTLEISTENADDFEKLMVTMRAYMRGLLAVQRSAAMVHNASMDATAPGS